MSSTGEVLRTEPRTDVHPRVAPTWMWSRSSAMRVHFPSAVLRLPGLDEHVHRPALVVDVVHFVQLARWERLRLDELDGGRVGTRTIGTANGGCPATSTSLVAVLGCRRSLDQVSNQCCSHLVLGHCLTPRHPAEPSLSHSRRESASLNRRRSVSFMTTTRQRGRGQCMDFVLCLVSASSRRLPNEMIWCANESDGGVAAEGDDCSPLIVRHVTDEEDWWASKHATRDVRPSGQRQRRPPFVPVIGASCSPSG